MACINILDAHINKEHSEELDKAATSTGGLGLVAVDGLLGEHLKEGVDDPTDSSCFTL